MESNLARYKHYTKALHYFGSLVSDYTQYICCSLWVSLPNLCYYSTVLNTVTQWMGCVITVKFKNIYDLFGAKAKTKSVLSYFSPDHVQQNSVEHVRNKVILSWTSVCENAVCKTATNLLRPRRVNSSDSNESYLFHRNGSVLFQIIFFSQTINTKVLSEPMMVPGKCDPRDQFQLHFIKKIQEFSTNKSNFRMQNSHQILLEDAGMDDKLLLMIIILM